MAQRIQQQLGNYRLLRLLGQGGFADTYEGVHVYLNTLAAIKVLQAQLEASDYASFYNEARTIANLRQPNIVRVLDFGVETQSNTPYLVMEYAPNGTLRQCHERGKPLSVAKVLPYVKDVAAALQYAHDRKIIHRDVKPENMLVDADGKVLLSDFGIAIIQSTRVQTMQTVAGTVTYMSPEQIQGRALPACDQYALAIVVYEWLTGNAPFQGTPTEIAIQHECAPPPPLWEKVPTISRDIGEVVMTALSKDPQRRFSSVMAFANAFEQASKRERTTFPATERGGNDSQMYIRTEQVLHDPNATALSSHPEPSFPYEILYDGKVPPPPPGVSPLTSGEQRAVSSPSNMSVEAKKPLHTPHITPPIVQLPETPLPPVADMHSVADTHRASDPYAPPPPVGNAPTAYGPPPPPDWQIGSYSTDAPPPTARRGRLSKGVIILSAAIALLLVIGGGFAAYQGIYVPAQARAQATATAEGNLTATANAARAAVQATQTARQQIYTQATSGTPLMSDKLSTPDNYGWYDFTTSYGTCTFVDGAYHDRAQAGYYNTCLGQDTNCVDCAFQVETTIISGVAAGIAFRSPADSSTFTSYVYEIGTDGSYQIYRIVTTKSSSNFVPLTTRGNSPAIHQGLNQMNLLTVIAKGSNFYFYANRQYVNSVSDGNLKVGNIGVFADSSNSSGTEVVFRNAQEWQL